MNNFPRDDMEGKEGYGYDGGRQYSSSYGTGHCSCAPRSSLLGGMPTVGLLQSRKETYTEWYAIVGKISSSGFLGMFFTSFLLLS